MTIDGTTQPGYSGKPLIEIDGSLVSGNWYETWGLQLKGDVSALNITNFSGPAIKLMGGTVKGCYLGTDRTGTFAKPNGAGILIQYGDPAIHTIGGPNPGDGNLIAGNYTGIKISTSAPVSIQGNTFGSNAAQTTSLSGLYSTTHVSVEYQNDAHVVIGGLAPNVFLGGQAGVETFYSNKVYIQHNLFGVTPAGKVIGNRVGIIFYQGNDNTAIGNTIKGNEVGIRVDGNSLRNKILSNSMEQNGFGIDLTKSYPYDLATPNDAGDIDVGPNNFINFPVLNRATIAGATILTGTLSTAPNRTHRIDLFSSSACHASGYGEGKHYLDAFDVTTDATGQASFTRTLPWMAPGTLLTATSTSDVEGTSEFSKCIAVEGPGIFSFNSATQSVNESGSAVVTVRRREGAVGAASVSYTLGTSTATPGADFTGGTGIVNFADGETMKTFTIPIINDSIYDPAETIVVYLTGPTNGTAIGSPFATAITIVDNDPAPAITAFGVAVPEGNAGTSTAEVRFVLSAPAGAPYTVPYYVYAWDATPGVDFKASSGTLTFLAGETEKRVAVTIIGDTTYESDESLEIAAGNSWAVVQIINDDPIPSVSVQDLTVTEGNGPKTALVTLTANGPVTGSVFVSLLPLTALSPTDFTARSGYVQFNQQASRTFQVTLAGDTEPEPNETFRVRISRNWGSFAVGTNGTAEGSVTILNDDVGVGPAERSIAAGESNGFTVQLGEALTQDATLTLTSDSPDAVSVPQTLVIRAGTAVAVFDATATVPGHTATIRVAFPASLGGATHDVRVHTYAKATLSFLPAHVQVYEGKTADVTVSANPARAMTIGLVATGPVTVPASLTIPADGSATFTVTSTGIGAFTIDAQLPADHGSEIQPLFGEVLTAPVTPSILTITPSHGPTSGGTSTTLHGAHLRAGCSVTFGGVSATAVNWSNASTMTVVTPPHAGGTVDVVLACGSDSFVLRNGFGYVSERPRVSSVSPATGTTGGGTLVRISGTAFDSTCWPFFGGNAATNVVARTDQSLVASSPARSAGTVDVSVRCGGGSFVAPAAYRYQEGSDPAPFINTIEPAAAAPGELITIRGLNFRGDLVTTLGGVPASILDATPETLVVRVPELPAGRVSALVTDTLGRVTTSGPVFSVLEARPPRINTVTPARTSAGGELDLTGEGFRPGYSFHIGGRAATIVAQEYTHSVVRIAPDVAPGSHAVEVRNSAGTLAALGPNVTIVESLLALTSVDPRCGTTDGGILGTLRGRGFGPGLSVAFDGVAATDVTVIDPTTLRLRVPPGSAGPVRVSLTSGTHTTTLTNGFTYDSPFAPRDSCASRTRAARH